MKKFLIQGKYANEDHPRQRQNIEKENFSKHDSSEHRENYFADGNIPIRYHKQSYEMERRPRATQSIQFDSQKNRFSTNPMNEKDSKVAPQLNDTHKSTIHSGATENYKKLHSSPPFYPNRGNAYPHSKNPTFKDNFCKTTDTNLNLKQKFTSMNDVKDKYFNVRKNCTKIDANRENLSIKNTHFEDEGSLPLCQKYSIPPYKSDPLLQYNNKQSDRQSNECFHDLPKKVPTQEEKTNCQNYSKITYNSAQKAVLQNDSSLYENMGFNRFELKDLLYYNVNLMPDKLLFEYASAVKCKILEKFHKFQHPERDELELLCEITDGDQSGKNQLLITTRTCQIVRNIMEKFPLLLNAQEAPHTSQIAYKIAPNLHYTANGYCCNYEPPVLEMVQNPVMLFTPTTNYNLVSEYNITQNGSCVLPKLNSDSFGRLNDDRENFEVQNINATNGQNIKPINSSTAEENKDTAFSEHSCSAAEDTGEVTPVDEFSFDEENSTFIVFGLDNLLNYDVSAMHGDMVFDYAFSMKQRILENIDTFEEPHKEKLKLLCELTDGTQREENQKLINEQMCYIITNSYENDSMSDGSPNASDKQSTNIHPRRYVI